MHLTQEMVRQASSIIEIYFGRYDSKWTFLIQKEKEKLLTFQHSSIAMLLTASHSSLLACFSSDPTFEPQPEKTQQNK